MGVHRHQPRPARRLAHHRVCRILEWARTVPLAWARAQLAKDILAGLGRGQSTPAEWAMYWGRLLCQSQPAWFSCRGHSLRRVTLQMLARELAKEHLGRMRCRAREVCQTREDCRAREVCRTREDCQARVPPGPATLPAGRPRHQAVPCQPRGKHPGQAARHMVPQMPQLLIPPSQSPGGKQTQPKALAPCKRRRVKSRQRAPSKPQAPWRTSGRPEERAVPQAATPRRRRRQSRRPSRWQLQLHGLQRTPLPSIRLAGLAGPRARAEPRRDRLRGRRSGTCPTRSTRLPPALRPGPPRQRRLRAGQERPRQPSASHRRAPPRLQLSVRSAQSPPPRRP
mmetsp:Transcript_61618/g.175021  ORF Transcript_61618/g.175021 Transcript_61618/m.175021 type:complete len:339 (+) Transcript_61618:1134-2150(+)